MCVSTATSGYFRTTGMHSSIRSSSRRTSPKEVSTEIDHPFMLHPGEFVLGSTLEVVRLDDDIVARLEGKSSLGRLGLLIHSTAGFVDPGFHGHLTLELSNVATLPIAIYPAMKIGQLSFYELSTKAEHPYGVTRCALQVPGSARPDSKQGSRGVWTTELSRLTVRRLLDAA